MLTKIDSIMFFAADVHRAAAWYAALLGRDVQYENEDYAFIALDGYKIGFHPEDEKGESGVCGQTVYWSVPRLNDSIVALQARGAALFRGPLHTDLNEYACMLRDPFGNTIGLISQQA